MANGNRAATLSTTLESDDSVIATLLHDSRPNMDDGARSTPVCNITCLPLSTSLLMTTPAHRLLSLNSSLLLQMPPHAITFTEPCVTLSSVSLQQQQVPEQSRAERRVEMKPDELRLLTVVKFSSSSLIKHLCRL